MGIVITGNELSKMSDENLIKLVKDRAVHIQKFNGETMDVRVKQMELTGNGIPIILTYADFKVYRQTIKSIEILDDEDCPNLVL